ncbi:MAG TPA: hypothetical protein VNJ53_03175, partial [Gaiellaceae bacterium]|nr:hypothetical protein [Gaiellaceae bacterium]
GDGARLSLEGVCRPGASAPPCGPGVELGTPYDVVLFTHCGFQIAVFDGRRWRPPAPPPSPPGDLLAGEMVLVSPDRAVFRAGSLDVSFVAAPADFLPFCA